MANAVGEIWTNTNITPNPVFHVVDGEKLQIPAGGFGGESQANIINALKRCGAVDRRPGQPTAFDAVDMIRALEAMPVKPPPS